MSSTAVGRFIGSIVKHCLMKLMPNSLSWPGSGKGGCCVATPIWNMIALDFKVSVDRHEI